MVVCSEELVLAKRGPHSRRGCCRPIGIQLYAKGGWQFVSLSCDVTGTKRQLCQDIAHDMRFLDASEFHFQTLKLDTELLVIDTHQLQDGSV